MCVFVSLFVSRGHITVLLHLPAFNDFFLKFIWKPNSFTPDATYCMHISVPVLRRCLRSEWVNRKAAREEERQGAEETGDSQKMHREVEDKMEQTRWESKRAAELQNDRRGDETRRES